MSMVVDPPKGRRLSAVSTRRRRMFSHGAVAYFVAAVDFMTIMSAWTVGAFVYDYITLGFWWEPEKSVGVGLWTSVIFVLAMSCFHGYRYEELRSIRRQSFLIALLTPSILAFLLAVIFFLKLGHDFSRGAMLHMAVLSTALLIGTRVIWHRRLSGALSDSWVRPRNAFFICPDTIPVERLNQITGSSTVRAAQLAWVSNDPNCLSDLYERLSKLSDGKGTDEIVILWQDAPPDRLDELLIQLRRLPLPVKVILDQFTNSIVSCQSYNIGGVPAFQVQSDPLSAVERLAKRCFDVAFASLALIALAPMMIIVAIAIRLDSKGPVFFLQRRRGYANRPFQIVKFRSMTVMEDGDDVRQATRSDPRVTRVGAFIRAFSIDELPQFLNVLRGEMSVVGPRPHAVAHDDAYDHTILEYAARRHVKPGVTGWAQVNGFRGETPQIESMEQRVIHDLWYIDNWSLWLDLKIVIRTMFSLRGH